MYQIGSAQGTKTALLLTLLIPSITSVI